MDDQQNQKRKGHKVEQDEKGKSKSKQQGKGESQTKNQTFSTSSPCHEFSFLSKSPPSISALDLSPADEIFFHGHLLPLRLLSHLPRSPRSPRSPTRSLDIDTFSLPIKEEEKGNITSKSSDNFQKRERVKSKSFSFFVKRRKLSFNMSHVIKRYMRVIKPLLFIKGKRENVELRRKPHSFSGYFSPRKKREAREGGGVVSAPVSRWISPRNSGKLAMSGSISSTKSDSTMEELQAAIQAAIAHCKNSVAMDEKIRS